MEARGIAAITQFSILLPSLIKGMKREQSRYSRIRLHLFLPVSARQAFLHT